MALKMAFKNIQLIQCRETRFTEITWRPKLREIFPNFRNHPAELWVQHLHTHAQNQVDIFQRHTRLLFRTSLSRQLIQKEKMKICHIVLSCINQKKPVGISDSWAEWIMESKVCITEFRTTLANLMAT